VVPIASLPRPFTKYVRNVGQIVTLSLLASAIQEHVLFLPAENAGLISERELRENPVGTGSRRALTSC
jgi:hypothetical protein